MKRSLPLRVSLWVSLRVCTCHQYTPHPRPASAFPQPLTICNLYTSILPDIPPYCILAKVYEYFCPQLIILLLPFESGTSHTQAQWKQRQQRQAEITIARRSGNRGLLALASFAERRRTNVTSCSLVLTAEVCLSTHCLFQVYLEGTDLASYRKGC
jgi:hypothetical protein